MTLSSEVSRAALAAGAPPRYIYWSGYSGRRYLFTEAGPEWVADLEDGVAIAVADGRVVWAGEAAALAFTPRARRFSGAKLYVHLLAATAEERCSVVHDLRPLDGSHLKLAA